jgi:hypothetical protein
MVGKRVKKSLLNNVEEGISKALCRYLPEGTEKNDDR